MKGIIKDTESGVIINKGSYHTTPRWIISKTNHAIQYDTAKCSFEELDDLDSVCIFEIPDGQSYADLSTRSRSLVRNSHAIHCKNKFREYDAFRAYRKILGDD